MFGIGMPEMLVILALALIIIGLTWADSAGYNMSTILAGLGVGSLAALVAYLVIAAVILLLSDRILPGLSVSGFGGAGRCRRGRPQRDDGRHGRRPSRGAGQRRVCAATGDVLRRQVRFRFLRPFS